MLKEYSKRFFICIVGLCFHGLGAAIGVKAGVAGTNAWSTLSLGLCDMFDITFGTGTFCISLAIIVIDLLGKGKLGFGTFLNATLSPFFSDLFLRLFSFIPNASNMFLGTICTLIGQVVISFATILYMSPALGCGPRDTLMLIIGRKFPKAPIGMVKFGLEMVVLLAGFLMGGPFGLGTVLVIVLQASIFQFACKVTHYEPRSIKHEDLLDTCRRVLRK